MSDVVQELASRYHSHREFIGSSSLKYMALSPKHFFQAWTAPESEVTSEAMKIGNLLHDLLLEQNVDKYCARPLNEKGELVRSNSKEYAAFLALNPDKTPIHPDLHGNLYNALTAFTENKVAMKMLAGAKIEHSIYATDHESGVKIKARPDIWGPNYLVDLKSTGTLDDSFTRTIFNLQYDFQLAHYAETIKAATGEDIKEFYVIGFERQAPFASRVYRIPREYIEQAKITRRFYLNEIALCIRENAWPSYEQTIIDVVRPKFLEPSTITFDEVG